MGGQRLVDELQSLLEEGPVAFHIVVPATDPPYHVMPVRGQTAEEAARTRLDAALRRLRDLGAEVSGEVGDPSPVDAVRNAVEADGYDGIVISTLPAGLSRWLGMDLPHRIERHFDLPVVHVEAPAELLPGGRLGGIVCGVDGSPGSLRALRWSIDEARLRGTNVVAVHVFRYAAEGATAVAEVPVVATAPPYEEVEGEARQILDAAIDAVVTDDDRDVEITPQVFDGPTAQTLMRAASGADLLVVGSRGRGGFAGLILGSVSQQCVSHAHCPVVIIPSPSDGE